jgi:hypothetical protein
LLFYLLFRSVHFAPEASFSTCPESHACFLRITHLVLLSTRLNLFPLLKDMKGNPLAFLHCSFSFFTLRCYLCSKVLLMSPFLTQLHGWKSICRTKEEVFWSLVSNDSIGSKLCGLDTTLLSIYYAFLVPYVKKQIMLYQECRLTGLISLSTF